MNRSPRRWFFWFIFLTLSVDALLTSGYLVWIDRTQSGTSAKTTERLVVLFSDFDANDTVDGETLRRIHRSVLLAKQRPRCKILCVGGARPKSGRYGAVLMRQELIGLGFDASRIQTETSSNSSNSNIQAATRMLVREGIEEATLISSPVHMPRLKVLIDKFTPQITYHFSPYRFRTCTPKITWLCIYRQIHHELAAFILEAVLSELDYNRLIDWLRP